MPPKTKICIVGLGYIGLPLSIEFARAGKEVFGFDVNQKRIEELKKGIDSTAEIKRSELRRVKITYSHNPKIIERANFIIIAIPTPIDQAKRPDLSLLKKASRTVGENLKPQSTVVLESTVYPGVTEEICIPIIEKYSHLKCNRDFFIGYSPERINPGDKEHSIGRVIKIISGMDRKTRDKIARVYGSICKVYKAPNIKTAEAAKVIENVQRDLNIALVNELSLIFHRLDISTKEVLKAAATKWNFHPYEPGMPSGHCIPVDPYYLTYRAEELGYHPQVVLAGRRINDYMPEYVADLTVQGLIQAGKRVQNAKVLILGLTFKENVRDIRNAKIKDVINKLKKYGIKTYGYDPFLSSKETRAFRIQNVSSLGAIPKIDAVILSLIHNEFKKLTLAQIKKWMNKKPVLIDIKSYFSDQKPQDKGFIYKCL